jgi:glycine/D-amino acid oxidase-like deaminating enzyme
MGVRRAATEWTDTMNQYRNGQISHWMTQAGPEAPAFPQFRGDPATADLAIVGGGLTGLWTAYYAKKFDPELSVVVLEAESIGYGASGRNGGWVSALTPGNRKKYANAPGSSREDAIRFQRAMMDAVDEVLDVCGLEQIEAGQHKGGNLTVATTMAGWARLQSRRSTDLQYGLHEGEVQLLSADQARERINIEGACGALYYPGVARLDPAKLVHQLAAVLKRMGVVIYEHSRVERIEPGRVATRLGELSAGRVSVCTEGYSGPLLGTRKIIPINSSMIVTKKLSESDWQRIGWNGLECLNDAAHTFIYAQRTEDGRIAIGGRGAPYRFASGVGGTGATSPETVKLLLGRLGTFFPGVTFEADHAWSGILGVTRDWCASINFDPQTGIGSASGYAGHGMTATNLAARTSVDLMFDVASDLTTLPWVGHDSGQWEPEPIRWLGVHTMYRLFGVADRWEESRGSHKTSLLARVGSRLAGLHE